jgi:hypothetical protein
MWILRQSIVKIRWRPCLVESRMQWRPSIWSPVIAVWSIDSYGRRPCTYGALFIPIEHVVVFELVVLKRGSVSLSYASCWSLNGILSDAKDEGNTALPTVSGFLPACPALHSRRQCSSTKYFVWKGKAIPVTGREGPSGCEISRIPYFV